jgi:sigma-B regulation protein RsbU (phosphoserine phosphatase)
MLVALLSSQYPRFAALAEAWLALGATAFGIWQEGRPLVYWPAGHRLARPALVAPIGRGDLELGDLRVAGLSGIAYEQRLRADAQLISYLLQLENELQLMTADLVTSQDQQLALYRLTQTMRDHVTVEETLQALVAEAVRMVRAESGYAMFIPGAGQEALLVQQPAGLLHDEQAWRLYWQGQSSERELQLSGASGALEAPAVLNLLHVPIRVRGTVMAGLGLLNRPGGFDAPAIKLARAIADQASAQIERMLLYQEMFHQAKLRTEMELARRVQLELLPRSLPRVPGLDIYANSRPAYQVGGDFFDFICADGRPFVFSLGDVTGKGLSAALLMTMTRTAIHSKAQFMPCPTPEAVMRQSNEDLYNDFTRVGVFATAFVGQYAPASQRLTYANAGHAPVIYRPRDGEPVLLRADSTAIGILPVSHCRNQVLRMAPDDLLIVATDGFSDARDPDEELFGIDRLLELVERLHSGDARQIAAGLFDATDNFGNGQEQDDDQTLVVIKGAAS